MTSLFKDSWVLFFIIGLALFYAWDLFSIYCEPAVSTSSFDPVPNFSAIVTSVAVSVGFASIALGLYKLKSFNLIGLAGTVVAGIVTLAGVALVEFAGVDGGLARFVVDIVTRLGSCWVIVAWGARYARLDAFRITVFTLMSFILALATGGTFSRSYIYKIVLPLIASGILLVATLNFETHVGPALISIGYTCFDLFCFTLFANACRKTGTDARCAFGWCRAIESSAPLVAIILMSVVEGALHLGDSLMVNLIGLASILVVVAVIMLDHMRLFEREQLNPEIEYPRAEALYFARQCEKAIEQFGLSPREAEVLSLIVRGRSVPHISQRLYISRSTVKTHITHIYEKLGVADRQEMIDVIESIALD